MGQNLKTLPTAGASTAALPRDQGVLRMWDAAPTTGGGCLRIGMGVSEDVTVEVQRGLAGEVEEAGIASLWTNEARGRDALHVCQAWASETDGLQVGVGVVPLWSRSAAQLAMSAATVQEASDGRLLLGIGVSHSATMGPWHDADFRKPLTAARETLTVLRTLFAGEQSDQDGEVVSSHRFQLQISPLPRPPRLLLGAMGPKMLRLAGERADGVLLNWSSPDEVRSAATTVRDAAGRGGSQRAPVDVVGYVRFAIDDDEEAAREALAREIASYCALPAYAEHFDRQGFGAEVDKVKSAYRNGGSDAAAEAVPEGMLLELGWYGRPDTSPEEVLDVYRDAGLDHLVARVVTVGDDPTVSVRNVIRSLRDVSG